MSIVDKSCEYVHHLSSFYLKMEQLVGDNKNLGQGELPMSFSEVSSLDQIESRVSFSELATEYSTSNHTEKKHLVLFPCLYGIHQ
jgi:hypothetical protein